MTTTKKDRRTMLEKEIDRIYEAMSEVTDQGSSEYQRLEDSLQKLADVQKTYKEATDNSKFSGEVLKALIVGGVSMAQTLLILYREEIALKVISSKALSFILKGRV